MIGLVVFFLVLKLGGTSEKFTPNQISPLHWFLQPNAADEFGTNGSNNLIRVNVYYSSMNEKTIEDKIDYSVEVKLNCRQLNNTYPRTGAFSAPWEVVFPFGLASPSATSLKSSSWLLTSLETLSTAWLEELLGEQQIHSDLKINVIGCNMYKKRKFGQISYFNRKLTN